MQHEIIGLCYKYNMKNKPQNGEGGIPIGEKLKKPGKIDL